MSTLTVDAPGIYPGYPEAEYHARPELSSTQARQILDSPARFHYNRQRTITSPAFDLGTAVHTKVLGVGAKPIAYPPEHLTASGNPSTKAATIEWAEQQRAAGNVPVAPADMHRVNAMAEAVLAHPKARAILEQDGQREASVFATDPETGVACRARFDFLPIGGGIASDLKTTAGSASPAGFGSSAAKYGYPVQEAHYTDTHRWVTGGEPVRLAFIVVEKAPPHLVAVHEFDEAVRMAARELAAKARHIYAECQATDEWPGHGDELLTPEMPAWWWHQIDDDDDMEVV